MAFGARWATFLTLGIAANSAEGVRLLPGMLPYTQTNFVHRPVAVQRRFPVRIDPQGELGALRTHRAVMSVADVAVSPPLDDEEMEEARRLFEEIDQNGDGQVTRLEAQEAMKKSASIRKALKLWDIREVATFLDDADKDNDGTVSFQEFTSYLASSCIDSFREVVEFVDMPPLLDEDAMAEAQALFDSIDKNGNGQVSRSELKSAMRESEAIRRALKVWSYKDCSSMVDAADTDKDGSMSFDEFKRYIAATCFPEFKEYMRLLRGVPASTNLIGPPRQQNPQVVVLRQNDGSYDVLLQLRSHEDESMPGHLSVIAGKWDAADEDSSVTAAREVARTTGLLDVWPLEGVPRSLMRVLIRPGVDVPPPPRKFFKFGESDNEDWWALVLEGSGCFIDDQAESPALADITPLLATISDAELAPSFGHAWVPVKRLHDIPLEAPVMHGLRRKVGEAVLELSRQRRRLRKQISRG